MELQSKPPSLPPSTESYNGVLPLYLFRVKNKRELYSSLKGATLGDPDDKDKDEDTTLKWVKRSRKKEKELAKKRLLELNKMDEGFLADYSESSSSFFLTNSIGC
jgi:hypothetical protein